MRRVKVAITAILFCINIANVSAHMPAKAKETLLACRGSLWSSNPCILLPNVTG